MTKVSVSELKKHLKQHKPEELISIIVDCYKISPDVKKYVYLMMAPEHAEKELYEEARKKILNQFYPDRGAPKLKFGEVRKVISEFGKLSNNVELLIDLMIYCVDLGVQLTKECGVINDAYSDSLISMFGTAIRKLSSVQSDELNLKFKDRAYAIVENANNTGWGLFECLSDIYYDFFDDVEYEAEQNT